MFYIRLYYIINLRGGEGEEAGDGQPGSVGGHMKKLRFERWAEFRAYVDRDRQVSPVYWRGQPEPGLPLASAFERVILHMGLGSRPDADMIYPYGGRIKRYYYEAGTFGQARDQYLEAFKRACAGLRGPHPATLNTDQWWALGRHYGLITPLLDWSESPYIAAFFPLTDLLQKMQRASGGGLSFQGDEIAVYRLFHNEGLEDEHLRVVRPMVDELGRLSAQRGLFTWLDSEEYFELQGYLDNTGRGDLLTQVILTDHALMHGLRDLKAHGIDYRLLFPDLEGAAKHANTLWDVF